MKERRKTRKKGRKAIIRILFLIVVCIIVNEWLIKPHRDAQLLEQLYQYMLETENQTEVFHAAVAQNGGKTLNTCVYFVSEALRENGIPIPEGTCNTSQLISVLEKKRWKKNRDYKNLKPGNIVFTTDAAGNPDGKPTHTYIFMEWVDEGNYNYAYICDNQVNDYNGQAYHIRNIKNPDKVNGAEKEAFGFFMRP